MPDYRSTVFLPKTGFPMKAGLPQNEPGQLERWAAAGLYARLREARAGAPKFIFHDGPPYANGDMHIGHALNHILKDAVCRTRSMLGYDAPYVPGWDCHGLPIEWKVEEAWRAEKRDKDADPAAFRSACRAYAAHWVDRQREQLKRLGVLADWDRPYLTMDFEAEAAIVAELMKFAAAGQVYRGAKPVMWSPVEKTALAEAEVEYEEVVSTQVDVEFRIVQAPKCPQISKLIADGWHVFGVVWTTTPWTIPTNQALAYSPTARYRILAEGGVLRAWIIAEELWEQVYARAFRFDQEVLEYGLHFEPIEGYPGSDEGLFNGSELEGASARHPMHHLGGFFAKPRPFLAGDFVTTEQGTGLVHMAPDHGEDDFALCKAHGIDPVFAVEGDGRYRANWAWLGGRPESVINPKLNAPDGPICSDLRDAGALLAASADYRHSYPHSWRSKKKLIFRATPQWFIPMDRDIDSRSLPTFDAEGPLAAVTHVFPETTLRDLALAAIDATRFYPEKGRNRLRSMVEGRPDWVISRQRAWGVPITLFVERRTGRVLVDAGVNARIVDAVRAGGVDAWSDDSAAALLGPGRNPADYERVTDILDVWFDSGSTHAFVLESGRWPELTWPADLYLEGSDQHRGWFQSSLLESCATRGRAPYDAVLTHGFTMDAAGKKMSKSLGNTVDPLELMKTHGADILRLWALSVDFTEDHRIGKEILTGVADQYRKLRNTWRYLLGALDGFTDAERVTDPAEMPELERWVLHRLAELDAEVKAAVERYDFNSWIGAVSRFAADDLSAFAFDVRKDSLYCDAPSSMKRRAWRTVLDHVFHAFTRWLAPALAFTAEEAWRTRFPEAGSVHLLAWDTVDAAWRSEALGARWERLRALRSVVTEAIEPLRKDKTIGSSNEAVVHLAAPPDDLELIDAEEFAELAIVGGVTLREGEQPAAVIRASEDPRCERCWRHRADVDPATGLDPRCAAAVAEVMAAEVMADA